MAMEGLVKSFQVNTQLRLVDRGNGFGKGSAQPVTDIGLVALNRRQQNETGLNLEVIEQPVLPVPKNFNALGIRLKPLPVITGNMR